MEVEVFAPVDIRSEEEVSLANAYADHHERLENFIFMYAIPAQLYRRWGIEFHSALGYAILFGIFFVMILVPGALLGTFTSWPVDMPPLRLAAYSIVLGFLNVMSLVLAQNAAFKISALHRCLRNPEQIRALIRWDRIWFGPRMSAVMGGGITLVLLVILYGLNLEISGVRLPVVTLWVCGIVTIFLGQFSFSTAMIFFEFRKLSTCQYELYKLNPYDTYALQRTTRGLKQLGLVSTMSLPFFLFLLLIVLPEKSGLNIPITVGFLLLTYLAAAIGILFPLSFLGGLVKREKWKLLMPLQGELNQLADRIHTMSTDELKYFELLHNVYDSLRNAKENFLSLGSVARIVGALMLSTITVILTTYVQGILSSLGFH